MFCTAISYDALFSIITRKLTRQLRERPECVLYVSLRNLIFTGIHRAQPRAFILAIPFIEMQPLPKTNNFIICLAYFFLKLLFKLHFFDKINLNDGIVKHNLVLLFDILIDKMHALLSKIPEK